MDAPPFGRGYLLREICLTRRSCRDYPWACLVPGFGDKRLADSPTGICRRLMRVTYKLGPCISRQPKAQSMKDLLEKLIGLIPAYFDDLLPLVSGPKRFIAKRLSSDELAMQKALIFLAVSFLIGWVLKIPLLRGDPFLELGTDSAFVLIQVMAYGGALYLAWRIAGGSAAMQKFLTIHFYYSGILKLIETSLHLGIMGTIRAADPLYLRSSMMLRIVGTWPRSLLKTASDCLQIQATDFRFGYSSWDTAPC